MRQNWDPRGVQGLKWVDFPNLGGYGKAPASPKQTQIIGAMLHGPASPKQAENNPKRIKGQPQARAQHQLCHLLITSLQT